MFPQVCAKCLPKRSSVSTAVCGFVYARACTCSYACVSSSFFFIRCVCGRGRGVGARQLPVVFLLLLFLAPDKRRRVRGAVLGDETAVAMAGCNTSSHCGGWLEALEETGSPPLYLHWHICSAIRFLTRPGIRKNKTKNKSNKPPPQTARSRRPHVGIYWNGTPPNCIIVLIDVVGRGACEKRGCAAAFKVDLAESSLNNMEALDWSLMWMWSSFPPIGWNRWTPQASGLRWLNASAQHEFKLSRLPPGVVLDTNCGIGLVVLLRSFEWCKNCVVDSVQ